MDMAQNQSPSEQDSLAAQAEFSRHFPRVSWWLSKRDLSDVAQVLARALTVDLKITLVLSGIVVFLVSCHKNNMPWLLRVEKAPVYFAARCGCSVLIDGINRVLHRSSQRFH